MADYTLETERTSTGFQHSLLHSGEFSGEFIEGSVDPEGFVRNPTGLSLDNYARLNEEILRLNKARSIEVRFNLSG